MIVLNSAKVAYAAMSDKGAIYSDRFRSYFIAEIIGWKDSFASMDHGPVVTSARRVLLQEIGTKNALARFEPMVQERIRHFIRKTLHNHSPQMLAQHARTLFGSIILDVCYGYQPKDQDDEIVTLIEKVMNTVTTYGRPGSVLVDIFPWLERLPSWMPGMGYRQLGHRLHQEFVQSRDIPYEFSRSQMATGNYRPSFVTSRLDGQELSSEDESILKNTAQIMYGAGAETTYSAALSFVLLMCLHPEVQTKAQAEVDSITGLARLPTTSDREHLPYLNAIISEVLRYSVITPLGVPHTLREDDIYNGFFIPKGAIIFPNVWMMSRDPEVYTNPETFNPERFMGSDPEIDPRTFVFGFGRRICPGRFFAENNLFLVCATLLATLNITRAHDSDGNDIVPLTIEYEGHITRHPKLFPCKIQARSAQAEALVNVDLA